MKRQKNFLLSVILVGVLALVYLTYVKSSKASPPELYELKGVAMTVPYRILIPLDAKARKEETLNLVEKEITTVFLYIDSIFNSWNPHSELSRLNHTSDYTPFQCTWDLYHFLKWTKEIVATTQGKFDPTVETLHSVWKDCLEKGITPNNELLMALSPKATWDSLLFDDTTCSIQKKYLETKLDLSGIVKGYTIDLLVQRLQKLAWNSSIYVEWGGEIAVNGSHPDRRPWKLAIYNTHNLKTPVSLELTSGSVATSGDYFQSWTVEENLPERKKTFTHIYTPGEKEPLFSGNYDLRSVTVFHPSSCACADAFATALFATKYKEQAILLSKELQNTTPGVKIWIESQQE